MPIINLLLSSLTSRAAIFGMLVSFYHCLAVRVFIISTWMSWWHTGFWRCNCGEFWKRRSPIWVPQKPLRFEYSGILFLSCSTMFTTILAHTYVSNLEWQNFPRRLWLWLFSFSQCASMYLYTWIQSLSAGASRHSWSSQRRSMGSFLNKKLDCVCGVADCCSRSRHIPQDAADR